MLIKRGAEAELTRTEFLGRPAVDKHRVAKAYRLPDLDAELRRARIRTEARLISEARAAGVHVPLIYDVDLEENRIVMEYVEGPTVKEVLDRGGAVAVRVAREVGRVLGRLHRGGIVHGDFTTSNLLVRDGHVVVIDFSLGAMDRGAEARGVDLHLLHEALTSAHPRAAATYREAVRGYREVLGEDAAAVLAKAKEIESRGRYT